MVNSFFFMVFFSFLRHATCDMRHSNSSTVEAEERGGKERITYIFLRIHNTLLNSRENHLEDARAIMYRREGPCRGLVEHARVDCALDGGIDESWAIGERERGCLQLLEVLRDEAIYGLVGGHVGCMMNIQMVGLIEEMRRSGYQSECCFRYQNERTHFDIAVHARGGLDFSRIIVCLL